MVTVIEAVSDTDRSDVDDNDDYDDKGSGGDGVCGHVPVILMIAMVNVMVNNGEHFWTTRGSQDCSERSRW